MKKRIDVFSDGSIAYTEEPDGYETEISNSSLGLPVKSFEPTDQEFKVIKKGGYKYDLKKGKLEKIE